MTATTVTTTRHRGARGKTDEPIVSPHLAIAVCANAGHHVRLTTSLAAAPTTYAMARGDLSIFAPYDPHRAEWNEFVDVVRVEIVLPDDTDLPRTFAPRLNHRDPAFVAVLRMLLDTTKDTEPLLRDAIVNALAVRAGTLTGGGRIGTGAGLAPRDLRSALAYIAAYANADIRLADIASAVGLSVFHFARMFARSTGASPHAFIHELRLARARDLLRAGRPVRDVAAEVGFASAAHFARAFKRRYAVAPSRMR